MNKEISNFLKHNHSSFKKIIKILESKFEYVSILATDCEGKELMVSEKSVAINDNYFQERGFVVRVFNDGLFSEYSFDRIDDVEDICNRIISSLDINELVYKAIYVKKSKTKLYEEEELKKDFSKMDKYEDISLDEIIKDCKMTINDEMEDNEYIISARFNIEYLKVSKMFISSKKDLSQVYAWADAKYTCIVNKDDVTKFNYGAESAMSLCEAINMLKEKIKRINEMAVLLLDASNVIPGEYDCITSPDVTGLIAHEAFGHGVEMDMFVKNRALGKQFINKQVGSQLVTMHEGAIPYDDVSSYFFDDEGTLAHDTIEIQDGILKTGIADAISASRLNILPTGNGKRESFKRKAYTRMTATYFESKDSNLNDMIASIQYGFLLDVALGGMEDPKNWGIQCQALVGREIKDGKLTGKIVSPIIITGYVIDLLNSVSMVSNDFALYGSGACGKGYKEFVKTSIGGPYLKVKVKIG